MSRIRLVLPLTAILGGLVLSPSTASPPGAVSQVPRADARVVIRDNFYAPRSVTIKKGQLVKWVWRGENLHNITFVKVPKGASKRGATARRAGRWRRVFRKPGFYKFECTLHAGQEGTIYVKPLPQLSSATQTESASG